MKMIEQQRRMRDRIQAQRLGSLSRSLSKDKTTRTRSHSKDKNDIVEHNVKSPNEFFKRAERFSSPINRPKTVVVKPQINQTKESGITTKMLKEVKEDPQNESIAQL